MKGNEEQHITSFFTNGVILFVLLILTFLTVFAAELHLGNLTIATALAIASLKGITVVWNYMHLKYESKFMKFMVLGVFVLYAIVLIITFIDYSFR